MPADLTAATLIALLRAHPQACGMLGVTASGILTVCVADDITIWNPDDSGGTGDMHTTRFRRWLTGACVEKHIELGMELPVRWIDGWAPPRSDATVAQTYTTFLHAMLAGLESQKEQA